MSLDELGRAATDDLHRHSGAVVDTEARWASLQRTRARRSRSKVAVVGVTTLALGVAGWVMLSPASHRATPPTPSTPSATVPDVAPTRLTGNGPIVILRSGHLATASLDGGDVDESIVRLPHGDVEAEDNPAWNRVSWSVDGRRLVYVTKTQIRALDEVDGSDRLLLACENCEAALSPDERRLAVSRPDQFEVVDLVSGASTTIPAGPGRRLTQPAWSPDGTSLAVVTVVSAARFGLAVVPADGSRAPVDLRSPTATTWSISPAWSPDGRTIAYVEIGEPGATPHPIRVMTVSPNGSQPAQLFVAGSCTCFQRVPGLTWSPDGTQLAVVDARGLEIADATVGAPLTLIAGAYAAGSPAWRPVPPDPG